MYGLPKWQPDEIKDPRLKCYSEQIKGPRDTDLLKLRSHLSGAVSKYLTKSFKRHTDKADAWRQLQGILFCIDCINKLLEKDNDKEER